MLYAKRAGYFFSIALLLFHKVVYPMEWGIQPRSLRIQCISSVGRYMQEKKIELSEIENILTEQYVDIWPNFIEGYMVSYSIGDLVHLLARAELTLTKDIKNEAERLEADILNRYFRNFVTNKYNECEKIEPEDPNCLPENRPFYHFLNYGVKYRIFFKNLCTEPGCLKDKLKKYNCIVKKAKQNSEYKSLLKADYGIFNSALTCKNFEILEHYLDNLEDPILLKELINIPSYEGTSLLTNLITENKPFLACKVLDKNPHIGIEYHTTNPTIPWSPILELLASQIQIEDKSVLLTKILLRLDNQIYQNQSCLNEEELFDVFINIINPAPSMGYAALAYCYGNDELETADILLLMGVWDSFTLKKICLDGNVKWVRHLLEIKPKGFFQELNKDKNMLFKCFAAAVEKEDDEINDEKKSDEAVKTILQILFEALPEQTISEQALQSLIATAENNCFFESADFLKRIAEK